MRWRWPGRCPLGPSPVYHRSKTAPPSDSCSSAVPGLSCCPSPTTRTRRSSSPCRSAHRPFRCHASGAFTKLIERCSDGVEDQGAEEAFMGYAKRESLRPLWKPFPCEQLFFQLSSDPAACPLLETNGSSQGTAPLGRMRRSAAANARIRDVRVRERPCQRSHACARAPNAPAAPWAHLLATRRTPSVGECAWVCHGGGRYGLEREAPRVQLPRTLRSAPPPSTKTLKRCGALTPAA